MAEKPKWYQAIQAACARVVDEAVRGARFDTERRTVAFTVGAGEYECASLGSVLKFLESLYKQAWYKIAEKAEPDDLDMTNAIGAALVMHRRRFSEIGWSLEGV